MSKTIELTTQPGHGYNTGDIVVFTGDTYFNNVVTDICGITLIIRKMKWYEDTDTTFLYSILMVSFNNLLLTFYHWF